MTNFNNSDKISFSWDLHYACNYRCPYCWWDGKWHELPNLNRSLSVDQWMKYWRNIYSRYGSVAIEILGGEPFIYPKFTELIKEISILHNIRITTNLSTDIRNFVTHLSPSKVNISPTFHPLFAKYDSFVKKALFLKECGFTYNINYLAYPPQIKQIPYYRDRFNREELSLSVMTFWGKYNGITYPDGYTEEERRIVGVDLGKRAEEEFQLEPKLMPKGRLCRAGQKYAVIHADGDVIRCGGSGLNESIGNFFDENFRLLEKPMPCKAEYCKCNEWAFLLMEKETPKRSC